MGQKDILIGKAVSFGLAGIAVIIFVLGTSKLVGYDAQENGLMTLKEGTFNTDDWSEKGLKRFEKDIKDIYE